MKRFPKPAPKPDEAGAGRRAREDGDIDFGILPELVGYHIRRAQVAVFGDFATAMADRQITPGQFGILELVGKNPGLSQSALARAVGVERSTMVAVINDLEQRDFIRREPSTVDRRSHAIVLTREGGKTLLVLEQIVREHDQRVSGHLSKKEKGLLIGLINGLIPGGRQA
ncbi:MAG: MarR family transcriptional regulator [Rhodospirillales bacterium]|nr:MarR family transcriptional regulator [Rhodospirillales bacterium]MCW8970180.1 MarR family transcriptional regulator [Rhodospirillales bacterium]MCW9001264.1 MarR family transcriptional regulator [Rhodospirillales bacterium]